MSNLKSNFGSQLTGYGESRNARDFYPSPRDAVDPIIKILSQRLPKETVFWEPSCGNGAISKIVQAAGYAIISTDLYDYGYGKAGINFLQSKCRGDFIITNPPFFLADEFILRAQDHISSGKLIDFAYLTKSQFWHALKRVEIFNRMPPSFVYAFTWRPDFTGQKCNTMEFQWNVWHANESDTKYRLISK